jgi:hypothetical protein
MAKHRHDDDTQVMERSARGAPEQLAVTSGNPASGVTVTVVNPSPPTNYSYLSYGSPPSPPGSPFVDDGTAGAITAIAAPTSGPVAEASGNVVVNNANPNAVSLSTMGTYTTTPNASHPSGQAPATLPTITALAPASTPGTGGTMLLTVTGTGFQQNSLVAVNGVAQTTNYVSPTTLEAPNAPKRTSAGTSPVTVVTNGTPTAATNWTFT